MIRIPGIYFLERCLYAYETGFHSLFNPALGNCRLSFKEEANK